MVRVVHRRHGPLWEVIDTTKPDDAVQVVCASFDSARKIADFNNTDFDAA